MLKEMIALASAMCDKNAAAVSANPPAPAASVTPTLTPAAATAPASVCHVADSSEERRACAVGHCALLPWTS